MTQSTADRQTAVRSTRSWADADVYLFDIDGTLLNCHDGVHYHAFHLALRQVYGTELMIDGVPVHGNTDVGILRAVARKTGLSDVEFEARLPAALDVMRASAAQHEAELHPQLCRGAAELLRELKRRGKPLGVVSGNLETIGWAKLRAAGLREFFAFGSFCEISSGERELRRDIFAQGLQLARQFAGAGIATCFVGDTPSDIAAARELGVPIIALAGGTYDAATLAESNPDLCLGCCEDLLHALVRA